MGHLSETERERTTEPFRRETATFAAEQGREAVVRAALLLPGILSVIN